MEMRRRDFLASLGAGMAASQMPALSQSLANKPVVPPPPPPVRKAKVTKLFKSPDGHPNALDSTPEGFWIGEQVTDRAILTDRTGKVLKAVQTESHNTSGMAVGGGYIWMSANGPANLNRPTKIARTESEVLQCDMNGKTIKHHDVPLGGGGVHGIELVGDKLWVGILRLRGLLQMDAATFQPIIMFPYDMKRPHGLAWDNGAMWFVDGADDGPRFLKLDAKTGRTLEIVQLTTSDPDPHGLAMFDGHLYYCDAGIHPGWEDNRSPATGYICRVDIL